MANRRIANLSPVKKVLISALGIIAVAGPVMFGIANAPLLHAQSATTDWEKAAGGKMSFSVASVKPDSAAMSQQTVHANVSMGAGNYYTPTGGLFRTTDFPLSTYISFAYKLGSNDFKALNDELPKWATAARYDIEARAGNNPTKDQMRLMMQSLLADRFKLAVHWEAKKVPVYALVLDKPGKTGPQLSVHPKDVPCTAIYPGLGATDTMADGLPITCGGIQPLQPSVSGRMRYGARNVTLEFVAKSLFGDLDRPVLDGTGLTGTFDFTIEYVPEGLPGQNSQSDELGPTFLEALKDQLGLKLETKSGTVSVIVLDHIEQPTPN